MSKTITKNSQKLITVALSGNANVGKSTLYNAFTKKHRHTGNWTGKTVSNELSQSRFYNKNLEFADLPGTYSLLNLSKEEEIARDFLLFNKIGCTCSALSLKRNLNLALQILEINKRVVICVNLLDEAEKKGIKVDLKRLSQNLGVSVIGICAHKKKTLIPLVSEIERTIAFSERPYLKINYPKNLERAVTFLEAPLKKLCQKKINPRFVALKLLEGEEKLILKAEKELNIKILTKDIKNDLQTARLLANMSPNEIKDDIVSALFKRADEALEGVITKEQKKDKMLKIDKILTGKFSGLIAMLLLLMTVFYLTIIGANYPSQMLSNLFSIAEGYLESFLSLLNTPPFLKDLICFGAFRTTAFIVSVMLPPMAIFFPLFTLLEELGFLPRIAFNLDRPFKATGACGKQALTMCMGFGCNAVGVTGARIINSPRERILSIITNSLVPCNGRFPFLIFLITMFLGTGSKSSLVSAAFLSLCVVVSIIFTFIVNSILSKTLLKGEASSFVLELPDFRRPLVLKTIWQSISQKTVSVLFRALIAAAPMGVLIFILANTSIYDKSLLMYVVEFLNPVGELLGLDGAVLTAFILGFPANEIVLPIIVMIYSFGGVIEDSLSNASIKELFVNNGFSVLTAVNTLVFCLFHFPCSTTLLTIKKETGSLKWTLVSFFLPLLLGMAICIVNKLIFSMF